MSERGTNPIISVIVPNYDGVVHLNDCLSALGGQTFHDFEILLVDNGSRDHSVDFVRAKFPEVRILRLPANRGFAGAINAGISAARGDFIALLNNDTAAAPGWLDALHRATNDSAFDMWASRVLMFDRPHLLDSAGDGFTTAAAPFKRGHLELARDYDSNTEVFSPSGSAALFRKALIEEAGLLDEDFFLVHEDVDFGLRARLLGYRCLYVADATVSHKLNSSIGYMSRDYVFYGQRNLEYVFWKDLPLSLLVRCLPAHATFNCFAFGHFILRGRGLVFIHAKLAALLNLPTLLRKRREIQTRRRLSPQALRQGMTSNWFAVKLRMRSRGRERLAKLQAEVTRQP